MSKPDDISQAVWDAADLVGEKIHGRHERGFVMWPLISEDGNPAQAIIARAITAAVAEEREACAGVADEIAAGRSRQKMQATTAKKRTEARDFETMAMSAIDVSYAIRARSTP